MIVNECLSRLTNSQLLYLRLEPDDMPDPDERQTFMAYAEDVRRLIGQMGPEARSSNSTWIANWVEAVAFRTVPLSLIGVWIVQLPGCMGLDLLN